MSEREPEECSRCAALVPASATTKHKRWHTVAEGTYERLGQDEGRIASTTPRIAKKVR